jgi:O-antigen/teichoic acid export membrane protein
MQVLTILAQAVLAATQVVFARLYGQALYGQYVSAVSVLEVFSRGGAAGADKAQLRYVAASRAAGDAAGVRSAIGTGLRLCLAVAGSFALLLLLGGPQLARWQGEPGLAPALRILAPLPLLTGGIWILIQASLAARVTRANFFVRGLAEPSLLLGAGVLAWTLGGGLAGLALGHLLAYAATLLLALVVVRRILRPEETRGWLTAPARPGFIRFALPIGLSELLNAVVQRASIFILTTVMGPEAVAIYNAGELLTRAISNIRYAFDSVVAGVLSEALHLGQHDRLRYNLRLATRWVVTVAAPIATTVAVLRHDLLGLVFEPSYLPGTTALVLLALSHFVNASLGLTGWVLMVAGRSHLGFYNNVVCAAFNLTAAYFLTRRYGVTGAAVAALATSVLMQGIVVVQAAVLEKVHPFSVALLKPLGAAAAAYAAGSALGAVIPSPWVRLPVVAAGSAVAYLLALWLLRLPPEEQKAFERALGRLRGRTP